MIPTLPFVQEKYDAFNKLCFGGTLPPVPIRMSRAGSYFGKVVRRVTKTRFGKPVAYSYQMFISARFDYPQAEVEDTIIHEMIHYYIGVNGIKDSSAHGQIFRQMMETINQRFGRKLTISHRSTPEQKELIYNTKKVWHVIALVYFADGRKGLKVLPRIRQRIEAYRTAMLRDKRFSRIEFFMSNDPYFNRFPNSSAFNVVMAKEDEFMSHIEQAEPLEL